VLGEPQVWDFPTRGNHHITRRHFPWDQQADPVVHRSPEAHGLGTPDSGRINRSHTPSRLHPHVLFGVHPDRHAFPSHLRPNVRGRSLPRAYPKMKLAVVPTPIMTEIAHARTTYILPTDFAIYSRKRSSGRSEHAVPCAHGPHRTTTCLLFSLATPTSLSVLAASLISSLLFQSFFSAYHFIQFICGLTPLSAWHPHCFPTNNVGRDATTNKCDRFEAENCVAFLFLASILPGATN